MSELADLPKDGQEPEPEIDVDLVGRVPLSTARQIYQSIARYFGGQTKLEKPAREQRARDAAAARWGGPKAK